MPTVSFSSILQTQFCAPTTNPELSIIQQLRRTYAAHGSGKQLVPTVVAGAASFPLEDFLRSNSIRHDARVEETHFLYDIEASKGESVYPRTVAGVTSFTYENVGFDVYHASWTVPNEGAHNLFGFVFAGEADDVGRKLMSEVYRHGRVLKDEIWVYEGNFWNKSRSLYDAIQRTHTDDLVLGDTVRESLQRDTDAFFKSKDVYESMGVTWKRGILLTGPPGNGKTETIKSLLKDIPHKALYVKSISSSYSGQGAAIRGVFEHARKHAPCILVLEDLDSMINSGDLSTFLNEMDGLAVNSGILTIATSNHPERIDDALLKRPSRFDTKYEFDLPSNELRRVFAKKWVDKIRGLDFLDGATSKWERIAEEVVTRTEGWSFAYLKELFVSYLLKSAHERSLNKTGTVQCFEAMLLDQLESLSKQIHWRKAAGDVTSDNLQRGPISSFNVLLED